MNAELQATNEELHTINEEMTRSSSELNALNEFQEAVFTSLRFWVIVLDRELRILAWNSRAEDFWGLRAEEVLGSQLPNLDIGLPLDRLQPELRKCVEGSSDDGRMVLPSTNRRGKSFECVVTCLPLWWPQKDKAQGAILIMEDLGSAVQS